MIITLDMNKPDIEKGLRDSGMKTWSVRSHIGWEENEAFFIRV